MADMERVVTLTGVGGQARPGMVVEEAQTLQPWSTFTGGAEDTNDEEEYDDDTLEAAAEPGFDGGGEVPLADYQDTEQLPVVSDLKVGGNDDEFEADAETEYTETESEPAEDVQGGAADVGEGTGEQWDAVGGGWAQESDNGSTFSDFLVSDSGNSIANLLESIAWSLKRITTLMDK